MILSSQIIVHSGPKTRLYNADQVLVPWKHIDELTQPSLDFS
jgi:hypothetical protein